MTDTLFKEVHYSLGNLIADIGLGRIGLPEIQRAFVWSNAKVRDLAALAKCGAIMRQGAHQSAQKSMSTGSSVLATYFGKVVSSSATGSAGISLALQRPHTG